MEKTILGIDTREIFEEEIETIDIHQFITKYPSFNMERNGAKAEKVSIAQRRLDRLAKEEAEKISPFKKKD